MLSIEHLYFSYQGQPPYVLNDLNLHIHSGDYISLGIMGVVKVPYSVLF